MGECTPTGMDSPAAKMASGAGAAPSASAGTGTSTPLAAVTTGLGAVRRGSAGTDSGSIFDGMTPGSDPGSGQKPKGGQPLPVQVITAKKTPPETCWFECGTTTGLLNIGNARSVRWCCSPCNGSRKGLDAQGRADDAAKASLSKMKTFQQGEYKALVRRCRIRPGAVAEGVAGSADRRSAVQSFFAEVRQTVGVMDEIPVLWPDQGEFVAYFQHTKGYTREAAELKWEQEKASPDTGRRGQGSGLRLAVLGVPRTLGQHAQVQSRSLASSTELTDAAEGQAALKRMRFGSFNTSLASQAFAEAGGGIFRPGATSSTGQASAASALFAPLVSDDLGVQPEALDRVVSVRIRGQVCDDGQSETEPLVVLQPVSPRRATGARATRRVPAAAHSPAASARPSFPVPLAAAPAHALYPVLPCARARPWPCARVRCLRRAPLPTPPLSAFLSAAACRAPAHALAPRRHENDRLEAILGKAESGSLQGQSLVLVRAAGVKYATLHHQLYAGGRANPMKTLRTRLTKDQVPEQHTAEVQSAIDQCAVILDRLATFKQKASEWVMDTVAGQVNELRSLVAQAEEAMDKLRSLGQTIKEEAAAGRNDRSKQKRKDQQELAGKARVFTDRNLPGCVLRFMCGLELVEPMTPEGQAKRYISNRTEHVQDISLASLGQFNWWNVETPEGRAHAVVHGAAGWRHARLHTRAHQLGTRGAGGGGGGWVLAAAAAVRRVRCVCVRCVRVRALHVLCASGDARTLASLATAVGDLTVVQARFAQHKVAEAHKFSPAHQCCQFRIKPSAQAGSPYAYERCEWLPKTLRDSGCQPENTRTFGGPWLLANPVGFHRFGMSGLPLSGIGQFWAVLRGSVLVMTWPFATFLDVNVQPDAALEFMSEISVAEWDRLSGEASWAVCSPKHVVWIPYAHVALAVSLQDGEATEMISAPVISTLLCAGLPARDRNALLRSFMSFGADVGDQKPWQAIVSGITTWFRACGATADSTDDDDNEGSDADAQTVA